MNTATRAAQVLSDEEMKKIYEAALRVWARVPLRVQGPEEFLQPLRDFGCDLSGELIRFPAAVREKVLARIQEHRETAGPGRPAENLSSELTYYAAGQGNYWCDVHTGQLRPGTTKDLEDLSRFCDLFPKVERQYQLITPQDVPVISRDVHCFATMMLNSSRIWPMCVYSTAMLPYMIELQVAYDGSLDRVRQHPEFSVPCYIVSPFQMVEDNLRMGMLARKLLGHPLWVSHIPVAGSATPVTLAGALVQSTAELLMGNTVTLALDDRLGMGLGTPGTTDMHSGFAVESGPDVALSWLASAQMHAYVLGGEYGHEAPIHSNAKTPGEQSMMDRTLGAVWGFLNGVRVFWCLGSLASCDVTSPVQLLLDLELMEAIERLAKGVAVDEDHLAEEAICEVGPTGARYLEHDHTARFCRELWTPELMDRQVASAWMKSPRTMLDNATARTRKLMAEAPNRCPLTEVQRKEIKRIVAAADAGRPSAFHTT